MAKRAWTDYRKVMSNLTPLVAVAPFPALAWYLDRLQKPMFALVVWCLCPIILWLGINFFGLFQNRAIRKELSVRISADMMGRAVFVGFSRPNRTQLIHHHEDVGWLILNPDSIEFIGDAQHHKIEKASVKSVRTKWNINTILGLGRWVCIDGVVESKPVRMLLESREKNSLLANFRFTKQLCIRIAQWQKSQ